VVVGLRPYTAKANILPEQTTGRGTARRIPTLRCGRTWPHQGHQAGPQYGLESRPTLLGYAFRAVNGGSTILRSEDGGRSWQTIHTLAAKR